MSQAFKFAHTSTCRLPATASLSGARRRPLRWIAELDASVDQAEDFVELGSGIRLALKLVAINQNLASRIRLREHAFPNEVVQGMARGLSHWPA